MPSVKYQTYQVQPRSRERLVDFILESVGRCGCRVLRAPDPGRAPFRFVFDTPEGERLGILCYAFTSTFTPTKNRPGDEHSFQIKYGSKVDGKLHRIWQDPTGAFTTLFMGVSPDRGYFVGIDPVLNSPTRFFIRFEYKQEHVEEVLRRRWYCWERPLRRPLPSGKLPSEAFGDPVQVVVGVAPERFLDYVRFERAARGLDQGHRAQLAEAAAAGPAALKRAAADLVEDAPAVVPEPKPDRALLTDFGMTAEQLIGMLTENARLMMAVRGGIAEWHLVRTLGAIPGVTDCQRMQGEGVPDVSLRFEGSRPLTVECKNVLRRLPSDGVARMDFMKTRVSRADPCSRYYLPTQFDVVAGCLHAVTSAWEFRYALTKSLDPHPKCAGRLSHRVRLDERWTASAAEILRAAAKR
jgi:hypothetical protein